MHTETQIITTSYVFRLSTVALLVPRVSRCILAAINRATFYVVQAMLEFL